MKIRKLHIKNYRAIDDVVLDFVDALGNIRPITVIAGPNGSGKTSILYAIVRALGVTGYNPESVPEPSQLDIRGAQLDSGGWQSVAANSTASVEVELEFAETEIKAIEKVYQGLSRLPQKRSFSLPPLPLRTIILKWTYPTNPHPDGRLKPWWWIESIEPKNALGWSRARGATIYAWKQKVIELDTLLQVGGIHFFPQDRALYKRVLGEGLPKDQAGDMLVSPVSVTSAEEQEEKPESKELSVFSILKYFSDAAHFANLPDDRIWEKRVQESFARVCAPKKYIGFKIHPELLPGGAPCFKNGGTIYPLHHAASGELVIIEYCARLNYPQPQNNHLILIDEPDAHLHPSWIRKLFSSLPQIGEGNQFVLTTHSQELKDLAARDKCLIDLGGL
ncbi:MAG: AAA family ATPase [Elusimicrobia bacterium]|nr:AAA family ATPase [Elusimicrobiota bacterium]